VNTVMNLRATYSVAERLVASQEGLSSMDLTVMMIIIIIIIS
jgi:hypothetical protein